MLKKVSTYPLGSKEFIHEDIECTEDGKYIYRKSKGIKKSTLGFYLRFVSEHWCPCEKCQRSLWDTIINAKNWTIGNGDYTQPIELTKRMDEVDDSAWVELEKRELTEKEKEKMRQEGVFYWS